MDKRRQWTALTLVAVLGVLAAGWFLLVSPKRAEADDLREQASAQQSGNAQLRTRIKTLKGQADALPAERAKLAAAATALPAEPAQPDLVRALDAAAAATGVELVTVAPGVAAAVAPTGSAPVSNTAGTLQSMPLAITVNGSYAQLTGFQRALEDLPRAVRVTVLAIAPGLGPLAGEGAAAQGAGALTDGQHLTATITATTYVAAGASPLAPAK